MSEDGEGKSVAGDEGTYPSKRKEIYTYTAPWTVYSMAWRRRPEGRFQLALGSFIEEYANQFHIVQLHRDNGNDEAPVTSNFTQLGQFDHPYPATKVMFAPPKFPLSSSSNTIDLLATSGDYLRIWDLNSDYKIEMKGVLNNNKHTGET